MKRQWTAWLGEPWGVPGTSPAGSVLPVRAGVLVVGANPLARPRGFGLRILVMAVARVDGDRPPDDACTETCGNRRSA
jgi:hypothetical protein